MGQWPFSTMWRAWSRRVRLCVARLINTACCACVWNCMDMIIKLLVAGHPDHHVPLDQAGARGRVLASPPHGRKNIFATFATTCAHYIAGVPHKLSPGGLIALVRNLLPLGKFLYAFKHDDAARFFAPWTVVGNRHFVMVGCFAASTANVRVKFY